VNIVLFTQTDERISVTEDASFVDYQTNLVRLAKQIARTAQEMVINGCNRLFCFVFACAKFNGLEM
jgi:predicted subunit of tRNA(5-methylaminomethyl-2-thiouridylate) methyltransferase